MTQLANHPLHNYITRSTSTINQTDFYHILQQIGVTKCCQMSYAPPEILFQISKINKILKSEITKNYDN